MEKSIDFHWGGFEKPKGWDGLNNAAINSFNSDVINSFVREMFQNSNDARQKDFNGNKKKLLIEIGYKKIQIDDFPEYEGFLKIINTIAGEPENSDHEQFFRQALSDFGKNGLIPVFVYKDFNTEGLIGGDDDARSSFSACVLSEGITVKGDKTAGGSYGIGKNSIYGFSKLRTVLYSSLNIDKEKIFQGLSKLASYRGEGLTFDYRTFFGQGPKLSSIRKFDDLPEKTKILIDRDKEGLTQIAICPIESNNWVRDFTKAILRNYWLLVDDDQLEVKLWIDENNELNISKHNLATLMFEYFNPDDFNPEISNQGNPYDFYDCYKNITPESREVHMLGEMKFYYKELSHKKTNCVAFIRNGMVIFTEPIWGFGSIGYCGVVVCNSENGNGLLRMMEPPTHDKFDPSRLNDRVKDYNENDGAKAIEQVRKLIRECLNKISDKYKKPAEEIPWLNNLLSSIKGIKGNGKGIRTGEESEKETIDRIGTDKKHSLVFNSVNRNILISTKEGEIQGNGGGSTPLPPHPPSPPNPNPGPRPGPKPARRLTTINARIFNSGRQDDTSFYKILLTADKPLSKKTLKLFQVGDSGTAACFEILDITDSYDNNISFEEILNKNKDVIAYKIEDISIPNELTMLLKEPYKSTFKLEEF